MQKFLLIACCQLISYLLTAKQKGVPTLVAWIANEDAALAETQSDDEILEDVMRNLRAMFPSITRPSNRVVITRWDQEDTIKGSYSFKKVGRTMSTDRSKLGERVGIMWFAGEATDSFYGTTEGAWKSGRRAALGMAVELQRKQTSRTSTIPSKTDIFMVPQRGAAGRVEPQGLFEILKTIHRKQTLHTSIRVFVSLQSDVMIIVRVSSHSCRPPCVSQCAI
ncbi:hypothetical protein ACHAWF_017992 [Thalassiosira exigua]